MMPKKCDNFFSALGKLPGREIILMIFTSFLLFHTENGVQVLQSITITKFVQNCLRLLEWDLVRDGVLF